MANLNKVYTISIQADAAKTQLAEVSKKLLDLDSQLTGLDRNSDQAKALVAEMAKLAKQVQAGESEVGALGEALDNLKPGTIPALEAEIEELEASLRTAVRGTAEFEAGVVKLGNAKGELKKLEDQIDAIADVKQHAAAFVDFANGVVGAFTTATVAAQAFGLSEESAAEYQKRLVGLISVLESFQAISQATNSETLGVIKSTYAAAKGYLGMGEAASTSSKVTRGALLATGLGALLVLIGLVISNFDKIKEIAGEIRAKFKPQFDAIAGFIDAVAEKARNLGSILTFGLIDNAAKHAQVVATETRQKELAAQVEQTARLVEILKARGVDTLAIEVETARRRLASLKNSTADEKKAYEDATKDYVVLRAQLAKRANDDEKAQRLAHLNGLAAVEAARGRDTFALQLATKQEQLKQLTQAELNGEHVTEAQKTALQAEIDALQDGRDKARADKRRAFQAATLRADLVLLQASTKDQSLIELEVNAQQLKIAEQGAATLRAAAQRDAAAIKDADTEVKRLKLERERIFGQQEAEQAQTSRNLYQRTLDQLAAREAARDVAREQQRQADLNAAQTAGARITERIATELAADLQLKAMKLAADADIGGNLLIRLFGLTDAQAQTTKARIAEFMTQAGNLVGNLMGIAQEAADAQLSESQAKLQEVTQQLTDAQSAANDTAGQIESASGARKDYLIKKLAAQRTEEERLSASRAKAALAEAAAEKEKQRLVKETTQLTLAGSLANTIATGTESVLAAVKIISSGAGLVFPADIIAIGTGLAVVTAALSQARALGKSFGGGGELGDGGEIVGGSHASGNDVAVLGGRYRVEGSEMITNVRSTQNNRDWLHLINSQGKDRRLTLADFAEAGNVRVLPHPTGGAFGGGGELGSGGSSVNRYASSESVTAVSAQQERTNLLLEQLLAAGQATANHTSQIKDYGPAKLQIGPGEAVGIRNEATKADEDEESATL